VDVAHPSSAPVDPESLEGILGLPTPQQPAECADAELVLRMLARRVPLLLLPDLAWPGRIPMEPAPTNSSAAVTGPIAIVGGTSTVRPDPVGRHAGAAAPDEAAPERAAPGRHRRDLPERQAMGRHEGDFPAGKQAC
jgi:hypothetical protein